MPKKKEQNILGLPPLLPPSASYTSTGLMVHTDSRELSPRERGILDKLHEDKLLIGAIDNRAKFGLETTNEMKWFAAHDFCATANHIDEVRQEAQGTAYQDAADEFCKYMMNLSARHTLGIVEIHGSAIAEIVSDSLLPPPPEPKKGFFARVFGGG